MAPSPLSAPEDLASVDDLAPVGVVWTAKLATGAVVTWAGGSAVLLFLLVHLASTGYLLPGRFL